MAREHRVNVNLPAHLVERLEALAKRIAGTVDDALEMALDDAEQLQAMMEEEACSELDRLL